MPVSQPPFSCCQGDGSGSESAINGGRAADGSTRQDHQGGTRRRDLATGQIPDVGAKERWDIH